MSDILDTIIETAGDVGKTALNTIYGNKNSETAAQFYTEQAQQAKEESKFWRNFGIAAGIIVGGLAVGKILKLY